MVSNPPEGMSQVIPYLNYDDVPGAVKWLGDAFALETITCEEFGTGRYHAEMRFGDGVIMMGTASADFGSASPHTLPASAAGVFIYLDGVDAHFAHAQAAGATIISEPMDLPYGRSYGAKDLEGHTWYFTEVRE
jgi:uncharacterized glyoxalase superfamily protein PhnB